MVGHLFLIVTIPSIFEKGRLSVTHVIFHPGQFRLHLDDFGTDFKRTGAQARRGLPAGVWPKASATTTAAAKTSTSNHKQTTNNKKQTTITATTTATTTTTTTTTTQTHEGRW